MQDQTIGPHPYDKTGPLIRPDLTVDMNTYKASVMRCALYLRKGHEVTPAAALRSARERFQTMAAIEYEWKANPERAFRMSQIDTIGD